MDGDLAGKCSEHTAWSDVAIADEEAHQQAVCSNRGECDEDTGVCSCMEGFEGIACNRMKCPGECSGHGRCRSMRFHAAKQDPATGQFEYTEPWDASMIFGCECDAGWAGYNCALRECPKGDDPLTTGQDNEVQLLRCDLPSGDGTLFRLALDLQFTRTFSTDTTAAVLEDVIADLPNVEAVTVTYDRNAGAPDTFCDAGAPSRTIVQVTFIIPHGDVPPLRIVDQNGAEFDPPIADDLTVATDGETVNQGGGGGVFTSQTGTTENEPCSRRGKCSRQTGVCECYTGFESSDGQGSEGTRGDCGYAEGAITSCPGADIECSGHGTCSGNPNYVCTCQAGWTSGDCSQRTCPFGTAWFDSPSADQVAHAPAECSNRGTCDRSTGKCTCESKFTGLACERMVCPGTVGNSQCSGHGQCLSMADLAQAGSTLGESTPFTYGAIPDDPLTWDAESVYGCLCDDDWTGYDCSQRACPKGDDVTTSKDQSTEVQQLDCTYDSGSPTFKLLFRDDETDPIAFDASEEDVRDALEALSTIGMIRVSFSDGDNEACTAGTTTMTFHFQTEHGDLPPIRVVENEGFTNTVDLTFPGTFHTVEVVKGNTENAVCNERGLCNSETGNCECFPGFGSSNGAGGPGEVADCGYREPFVPVDPSGSIWARVNAHGKH